MMNTVKTEMSQDIMSRLSGSVRLVRRVQVSNGVVYVYEVVVPNIVTFYVATYFDGEKEYAYGVGSNVRHALEDAKSEWLYINENPFDEALIKLGYE